MSRALGLVEVASLLQIALRPTSCMDPPPCTMQKPLPTPSPWSSLQSKAPLVQTAVDGTRNCLDLDHIMPCGTFPCWRMSQFSQDVLPTHASRRNSRFQSQGCSHSPLPAAAATSELDLFDLRFATTQRCKCAWWATCVGSLCQAYLEDDNNT